MKSRLVVDGVDLAFISELPISVNMAIADVRDPGKRNSSFSKTISIPGTPEVIKKFEYIFEINSTLTNFNPNLKIDAAYYVNEVRVFKGGLQLLKIKTKYTNQNVPTVFECNIIGETGNLFLDIAGLYLTDLDFSEYDHNLTYASGLFNPTLGSGFVYPYIDYGLNSAGNMCGTTWTFEHLKPAIFEREYVSKIFSNAGYTWEAGGYFDSDHEKHIIIPNVAEGRLKMPQATQDLNAVYAGRTTDDTTTESGTYTPSEATVNKWIYNTINVAPVPIDTDSSGSFYDPNNLFNTSTYIYQPSIQAYYTIRGFLSFDITITPPAGTVTAGGVLSLTFRLEGSTNGGSTWNLFSGNVSNIIINGLTASGTVLCEWNGNANSGTIFRLRVLNCVIKSRFLDNLGVDITTGTTSVDFDIKSSSYFFAFISSPDLQYGNAVEINQCIPTDTTQLDFLTSIIKSENLYLELDRLDSRKYVIESREDFIQETDPLDWTTKQDLSKDVEILPMGELDAKKYVFTYKSDKDYFNTVYENEFKEVYGTEKIDVENDFIKNEKKIDLVFSATPIASHSSIDIVAPRLFKSNSDPTISVEKFKCNIRRLYWGGVKTCGSHTLVVNGSNTTVSEYPFCGHVDDPDNPTVDLCFDNPLRLYWNLPAALYTNNNRYNERYSKFITEITDPNSKIVKSFFVLNENDISKFSFRKIVFVAEAYYSINKIMDYDPQVEKSVLVEMLKLKKGATFSASQSAPSAMGINNNPFYLNPANNYSMSNGMSFGQNNINNAENSLVVGDNNVVS